MSTDWISSSYSSRKVTCSNIGLTKCRPLSRKKTVVAVASLRSSLFQRLACVSVAFFLELLFRDKLYSYFDTPRIELYCKIEI